MSAPRIVVAASPHERIAAVVCEYTIKKHCPEAEVTHTFDREDRPTRGVWEEGGKDGTRFTWVRFWVPELMGYEGRAIYLDADMILFSNICELYDMPMDGKSVLRTRDPSVLLIDCERCRWDVRALIEKADAIGGSCWNMDARYQVIQGDHVGTIPEHWNHRDVYDEGETKLLHFTNMSTQPWPNHRHDTIPDHPLGDLWFQALAETVQSGLLSAEEIPECLRERINAPAQDSA